MKTKMKAMLMCHDEALAKKDIANITRALELLQKDTLDQDEKYFVFKTVTNCTLELQKILQKFVDSTMYNEFDPDTDLITKK